MNTPNYCIENATCALCGNEVHVELLTLRDGVILFGEESAHTLGAGRSVTDPAHSMHR